MDVTSKSPNFPALNITIPSLSIGSALSSIDLRSVIGHNYIQKAG